MSLSIHIRNDCFKTVNIFYTNFIDQLNRQNFTQYRHNIRPQTTLDENKYEQKQSENMMLTLVKVLQTIPFAHLKTNMPHMQRRTQVNSEAK